MTLRAELKGKNDILGLLGSVPLFSDLPEPDLRLIQTHAAIKSYRKNTVVIEQGDESNSLYIVARGQMRVYLANEEGKELLIRNLGPGDYFGELALLGGIPRTASVMTETDARLLVVTKQGFVQCVRSNPDIALETIRQLVEKLSSLTEKTGVGRRGTFDHRQADATGSGAYGGFIARDDQPDLQGSQGRGLHQRGEQTRGDRKAPAITLVGFPSKRCSALVTLQLVK